MDVARLSLFNLHIGVQRQEFVSHHRKVKGHNSIPALQQLVLTAILTLSEAYGVTIHAKAVELARPKSVSLGAIYYTLDRLEEKGFVSSWLASPTAERGHRAKRRYRLEALGERAPSESVPKSQKEMNLGNAFTEKAYFGRWRRMASIR